MVCREEETPLRDKGTSRGEGGSTVLTQGSSFALLSRPAVFPFVFCKVLPVSACLRFFVKEKLFPTGLGELKLCVFRCVLYGVNFMLFLTWPLERFLVYAYLRPFNFERFLWGNIFPRFVIFGVLANYFLLGCFCGGGGWDASRAVPVSHRYLIGISSVSHRYLIGISSVSVSHRYRYRYLIGISSVSHRYRYRYRCRYVIGMSSGSHRYWWVKEPGCPKLAVRVFLVIPAKRPEQQGLGTQVP